jgi:hypothetical protein
LRQADRLLEIGNASALRACLEDPFRPLHRFCESLAEFDGKPTGLFAVHVFARFGCQHGCGRMPPIACSNEDRVDIFAIQQLAKVTVEFAVVVFVLFIYKLFTSVAAAGLHIRDSDALHIRELENRAEIIRTARPDSNDPECDFVVRSNCSTSSKNVGRDYHWQGTSGEGLS